MSLTLHYHPLSSYCQKAVMALYENATPFEPHLVNLQSPEARAALVKLWPLGKFPVLQDGARIVPESSAIIVYLDAHHPGKVRFVPEDPELEWRTHLWDRFYDLYVDTPMGKIVADRFRPPGKNDLFGVEQARDQLKASYAIADREMADKTWAVGDAFTLADCAAAPALWYADMQQPMGDAFPNLSAYLTRLTERPSFARALKEASPYLSLIPK